MTDERMREALEKIEQKIIAVKGHLGSGEGDFISGLHASAAILREALSPPARRTSTDADVESMIDIEGIVRGNAPRRFSDDPYTFGLMQRMVIEGAKATLAGLEKEE